MLLTRQLRLHNDTLNDADCDYDMIDIGVICDSMHDIVANCVQQAYDIAVSYLVFRVA